MKKTSTFPMLMASICALGLMTCVVSAQLPNSLTNGLVAYYPFEGNANDASGNGNHLSLGGAVLTNGRTGGSATALEIPGAGIASVPVSQANIGISGNAAFSVSFWIAPKNEPSWPSGFILGWGGGDPGQVSHFYYRPYSQNAADFNLHIDENFVGATVQTQPNSLVGRWSHIAYTYAPESRSFAIYQDGMIQTNNFTSFNMQLHDLIDTPLTVGGLNRGWDFTIDDIAVYDRTLSTGEVTDLYNAQVVPEPSTYALLLLSGAASLWALKRRKS